MEIVWNFFRRKQYFRIWGVWRLSIMSSRNTKQIITSESEWGGLKDKLQNKNWLCNMKLYVCSRWGWGVCCLSGIAKQNKVPEKWGGVKVAIWNLQKNAILKNRGRVSAIWKGSGYKWKIYWDGVVPKRNANIFLGAKAPLQVAKEIH